jgi:hypothetical protein
MKTGINTTRQIIESEIKVALSHTTVPRKKKWKAARSKDSLEACDYLLRGPLRQRPSRHSSVDSRPPRRRKSPGDVLNRLRSFGLAVPCRLSNPPHHGDLRPKTTRTCSWCRRICSPHFSSTTGKLRRGVQTTSSPAARLIRRWKSRGKPDAGEEEGGLEKSSTPEILFFHQKF